MRPPLPTATQAAERSWPQAHGAGVAQERTATADLLALARHGGPEEVLGLAMRRTLPMAVQDELSTRVPDLALAASRSLASMEGITLRLQQALLGLEDSRVDTLLVTQPLLEEDLQWALLERDLLHVSALAANSATTPVVLRAMMVLAPCSAALAALTWRPWEQWWCDLLVEFWVAARASGGPAPFQPVTLTSHAAFDPRADLHPAFLAAGAPAALDEHALRRGLDPEAVRVLAGPWSLSAEDFWAMAAELGTAEVPA